MPSNTDRTDDTDDTDDAPSDAAADVSTCSRRRLLGGAAAAATVGLAGCTASFVEIESETETVERTFDAADLARLRVDDAADDVGLERTDGDAVEVTVHKRAHGQTSLDELELWSRVDGDTLRLGTRKTAVVGIGGGSVDLEVAVPSSVLVDHVGSSDGSVGLRDVTGAPTVETHDGDVAVQDVAGDLTATSDDGTVAVQGASGIVTARSRDGDVVVRAPGRLAEASTNDGDVVAEVPRVDGSATVRSRDGTVVVTLGETLDARVEATTNDGRVVVTDALDRVESVTERRVVGSTGDGSNVLRVHSDDGDVTLTAEPLGAE